MPPEVLFRGFRVREGPVKAAHTEIPASPSAMCPGSPTNMSGLKSHFSDTETEAVVGGGGGGWEGWPMAAQ